MPLIREVARYLERRRDACVDQVANRPDALADLTPASQAPAEAVRAAWAPTVPGQAVPMIGERVYDGAEPCDDV